MADLDDPFNTPGYYYTPYGVMNPYYILEHNLNTYNSERFYGKFQVDYEFLKYFKFTYRMGLDTTTGQTEYGTENLYDLYYEGTPNGEEQGVYSPFQGQYGTYSVRTSRRREINQDLLLTFSMPINDFHINALVGFNGNERKYSYQNSEVNNLTIPTWYDLSNSAQRPTVSQYRELRRLMGVFGQVEASWKDMLYLTVTARNDWSSTLPKGNRDFFYPGVTGSFLFSELLDDDIKEIISKVEPEYPTEVLFYDNVAAAQYQRESSFANTMLCFSIIAIVLSLVGVFSMVIFDIQHKRKEIAIRKVFGADYTDILWLGNKPYFFIVLAGFIISIPVSVIAINEYLRGFAMKVNVSWWIFLIVFLFIQALTAILVVLRYNSIALESPNTSLETE